MSALGLHKILLRFHCNYSDIFAIAIMAFTFEVNAIENILLRVLLVNFRNNYWDELLTVIKFSVQ